MKLIIYGADVVGVKSNCLYPHRFEVDGPDALRKVIRKDHVCGEYKDNYRGSENFIVSNCVVMDVDNDHSENPSEWITPESLADEYRDIRYAITYSRHHMKQKDGYGPRPRFHIYFEVAPISAHQQYKDLKVALHAMYPFYDDNALDAGRFIYGSVSEEVIWHDGPKTIESVMTDDSLEPVIVEGNRNRTMFQWALKRLTRYGNTDEVREQFYRQAENCRPPLEESELETIWRSASRYYKKIASQPGYIGPDEYNGTAPPAWEDPIPFGRYSLAEFPVDALPAEIAEYVAAVAESTQTPVDMAGTAALTLLAVCTQGKYVIQGKADWIEPLNLFSNIIAMPSERKSAVLHATANPLDSYELQYNQRNAARVESSKMRRRILERRQKAIEDKVAKGQAEADELERIAQEIAEFEEEKPLHLYVDDITTEKLVSVMAGNHGRAALISSEGGIFDTLAGIYTKNVNIDVMLKGYSGDTIRVDRIGRESESIMNPSLSILLMTQPKVVSDVLGNATFRGRGLTARFLYCLPASTVGERRFQSQSVPDAVYQMYEQKIVNMLEDEYPPRPEVITLSPEASALLTSFAEEIEPKLKTDYADIADWVGKLVGNTLRIAGLLCRADVYRTPEFLSENDRLAVSGETMANAIRLGRYFLSHALAVYDVIPEVAMHRNADRILRMIREKKLTAFDRRTAMRNCRSFKTVADIQPVLDFLDDYGYISRMPEKNAVSGRPPLPKYTVNPRVLSQ
ncbi:MAG: DUF3987 domain-containing protein [Oscillospiraceae bacterium]|nr:DUF3987 domain-containing protein [Oscillospiraceae bacterium]